MSARWTPESEELVARVLAVGTYDSETREVYHIGARAILTAQADARLLIPLGAEAHEEWCVGEWNFPLTEGEARARLDGGRPVKRRARITTPWTEVEPAVKT